MNLTLPEHYKDLTDSERKIIQTLALVGTSTSLNALVNCLVAAEIRNTNNTQFTSAIIKPILFSLANKGWVDMMANFTTIACKEKFRSPLVFDMIDDEAQFTKVYNAINRFYSAWSYYHNAEASFDATLRDTRVALFQGRTKDTIAYLQQIEGRYGDVEKFDALQHLFFNPFDKDIFKRFHPDLQAYILNRKLVRSYWSFQPMQAQFLDLLKENANSEDKAVAEGAAPRLAMIYLLQGNFEMVEVLIKKHQNIAVFQAMAAALRVIKHKDYEGAVELFAIAQKTHNQINKTKTAFITVEGLFYAIALIAQDTPDSNTKADKYLMAYGKNTAAESVCTHLRSILILRRNDKAMAQNMVSGRDNLGMNLFFALFGKYWVHPEKIDEPTTRVMVERAVKNGYMWAAYEMASTMACLDTNYKKFYTQIQDDLAKKMGFTHALHEAVTRLENWQLVLSALEQFTATGAKGNAKLAEGATRLVWLVDVKKLEVQPKEQTLRKNGTWTDGRNVALTRLRDGSLTSLTVQDRTIIAKSVEQYTSGWYGNTQLEINGGTAIKEMVGHPLLFLMNSPSVSFTISEEQPALIIKEEKGEVEIKFSTEIERVGAQLIKETPTRYKLMNITAQHLQLAQALGGSSVKVPKKAQERLLNTVSGLTGMIQIQSTVEGGSSNAKTVETDTRIYLHLLPVGDGFYVEFFVRPLRDVPPYFKPGKGEEQVFGKIENVAVQTKRKLKDETKALKAIIAELPELAEIKPSQGVYELDDAEQCLRLLVEIEPLRKSEAIVLEWPRGEKFRVTNVLGMGSLSVRVKRENDWFGMTGEVKIDENTVMSMSDLLAKVNASKNEFIELTDGKFMALTKEFRRRLREIETFMQTDKNGNMQVHPLAASALNEFGEAIGGFEADKAFKDNLKKIKAAFKPIYVLPEGFKADLRPYQMDGFQWLSKLAAWGVGACLADDMGLGKTVQALALILNRAHAGPTLVLAPVSVCGNWLKESNKFTPQMKPVFFGEGDRKEVIEAAGPYDLLICTYGLLQREGEMMTNKQFATIVLDEAQAIKNKDTKRSEIAMKLKGDFKIITTGTPIENHLGEIWNLFNFINPGLLGNLPRFNEKYATPIEKNKDDDARNGLKRILQPFILRRRKDEVLKDLPAKTEIVLDVELSKEERAFYEALRRSAIDNLTGDNESGGGEKHLKILAEIMRLRRACCNPVLVDKDIAISSTKLAVFDEIVDELIDNGHKALVFSQFTSHLALLKAHLDKKGIIYQYLDGSTPAKKRQDLIDKFQAGEGDLFLISLKAGGSGLNLTAADYVIHMDPWWNPAVEDQATDRAHRIGQDKPVTVYRLVTTNTIESKILKLHEHKRDLADQLLTGSDVSAKLTADDLLDLLKG
jgi:superfamily II DNA or RNA helicase